MHDRQPGAPGQYKAIISLDQLANMQAGNQFSIIMTRDDQPIREGTPYNTASVLPSSLAALICPNISDPTPADALRALYSGRAPAGYGLGSQANATVPNLDNATECGWYVIGTDTENAPFPYGVVMVIRRYESDIVQIAFSVKNDGTHYNSMAVRTFSNSWTVWHYDNPPMKPGVVYPTTQRHNGKVVYAVRLNVGVMANNGNTTVSIPDVVGELVELSGSAVSTAYSERVSFPAVTSSGAIGADLRLIGTSTVSIRTFSDYSTYTAMVTVKFTKD